MALSDHTLIAAYPLGSGIADLQDSYDGYSAQNMTFAGDGDLSGLPVADFNSSYYGVDNDLYNGFDTEYSFSMWMKPDTIAHSWLMNNEQHGSYYVTWGVLLQADGQVQLFVRNANGGAYDVARTGVSLVVDEWSHVAATWNGTEIKWYVDGALESTTAASRIPWNSPATLWIGANATKSGVQKYYFDGKMSDLRFWYSELTASDISELYAAGQVPIDLGLVLHHDCDDATAEIGEDVTFTDVSIGTSSGRTHWDFANLNSKAVLSDPNNLPDMAGDWTVSMWFSEMTAPTTWRSIAKSQTELLGVVSSPHHTPANTLGVYTTGGYISAGYSMNYLEFQNWNHMVIVGSGTTTKFYINGSHVGTAPAKVSTDLYSINNQPVGSYNQLFANNIDDVRVWSRALGASEVTALHAETYVPPTLADDLVGVWNFDSADATDSVGSIDGTVSGAAFGSGLGRSFASFDGSNDSISISHDLSHGFSGTTTTVSTWIKTAQTSRGFCLLKAYQGNSGGDTWYLAVNDSGGTNKISFYWRNNSTSVVKQLFSTSDINDDVWHHIVTVRSGENLYLYIDGVLEASESGATGTFAPTNPLYLGKWDHPNHSADFWYNGELDDVRVWSRALGASEVTTLHTETIVTPSLTDGLIHKWSLDTDGSAEVGSVDLVAHNSATHIDNVGSLSETGSGFHPATSIALNPSAGYTISTWFKGLKSNAFNQFVAGGSSGTGGNFAGSTAYYDIAFDSTDLYVWMQTSPYHRRSGYDIMSDTNLDTGWHNIVAAYDGTQTTFYVDGVQVGNPVTWSGSPSIQTFGSWKNSVAPSGRAPADFMDDIRVWSRTLSASEVSTLHAAGADSPAPSGYDWTHGGNLSDIVKFSRGSDISGNPSYAYAKKEPGDGSTTLYFATDFQTWSTFSSYASGVSSIDGSPICMEYGPNGKVLVGTDSGKLYEIVLDGSSAPQSYSLVHSMAGSEDIKVIKYGVSSNLWAFEAGGKVYTIPVGGGAAVEKLDLNVVDQAGSIVQDMSEANDAWSIVVRRSDFTFVVYLVSPDWSTVNSPASLQAVLSAINPLDLNYFYDIDTWCASGADGTTVTTDDINNWIA